MLSAIRKLQTTPKIVFGAQRGLKARRLLEGRTALEVRRRKVLDIQGSLQGALGVVRMNREHKTNILTPGFVKQVARGVESMYHDHSVRVIYLAAAQGQHFSGGTDFRTMLRYKEEGQEEKLAEFMTDVFKLQASVAKINKPIMAVAPGHAYNSGLGLLAASGYPTICHNTRVAFNECTFGFTPHAGSTYYAQRLPGDFGTFLVLTGTPISGMDAIRLGMADKLVELPRGYDDEVAEIVRSMEPWSLPDARAEADMDFEHFGAAAHEHGAALAMEQKAGVARAELNEFRRRTKQYWADELYVDPADRAPDPLAQADLHYKRMIRDHSQGNYGSAEQVGYFEHGAQTFNQFATVQDYLKVHTGHEYRENLVKSLLKHKQLIDRCFWPNSVEEIMDNLRRETDPIAKDFLARMESNSMTSMKIALKMLREARNMCFGEVLKMELNVALNKVMDDDFALGVKQVLMKPRISSGQHQRVNPGFSADVSDELVNSYFVENPWASKVDLDIVQGALLPTRHFFDEFADSVRIYINEIATPQSEVRAAVESEIQQALRLEGIDLRDKTVTVPLIRHIYDQK